MPRIDPAPRRRLHGFLMVFGAWTVVGLFYLSQDAGRRSFFGDPRPWQETMYWAVRVYVSAAFTPLILWLGRRWPIERPHLVPRSAGHVLAAAVYAVCEVAVETAVLLYTGNQPGTALSPSYRRSVAILLVFGFHANVISYGVILGIQSGFRYYRKYREHERQAMRLELDASELRVQIADARLSGLKMQLQPHFLFNTLNAIMVLVRQQRGQKAEETLGRFSDLLRAVLSDIDAQEVPLERELEYLRLYLSIEEVRFPDRLRVEIDAGPEVLRATVPHMGLQPLVENAVRHGIGKNAGAGLIAIRAVRSDERLEISVSDNGPGLPAGGIAGKSLATAVQDLRYAVRQLRANPGFAAVAILSLALGIGANTAIFQLVDAVRLKTLPVAHPRELVNIEFGPNSQQSGSFSARNSNLTFAQWEEIRTRPKAFAAAMAWSDTNFNLSAGGEARYVEGLFVSGGFFGGLGVPALLGRTLAPADDQPGCGAPSAVISYAFWQREFAGDPAALGRTVRLDGRPLPVVGVTGPGFFGVDVGHQYDVAVPICADPLFAENGKGRIPDRHAWWLAAFGRLKPGWTLQRANAEIQVLSPAIMQATVPPTYRPEDAAKYLKNKLEIASGATGVSRLRRSYESPLSLLLATTGLVLLIACANLANLLLARASVREREIGIRQAIGASRTRLITQLLTESLLLAVTGAALGALLARILSRGLVAFLSTPDSPVFVGLEPDLRMLGFTAAIAIGTCLLFGLLPALRATRVAPASVMRAAGRGLTAGRERFGLRRALVAAQVALSLVLLVGALLFVRSLQKLLVVDTGFRPEGIISVDLDLRRPHYSKERLPLVFRDLQDRLASRPGVTSVAQVDMTPISGSSWNESVWADGSTAPHRNCFFNHIGPGYFHTMGTALVAGRDFNDRDTTGSTKVAIVTQAFAKTIFGDASPLGRSFRVQGSAGKPDPIYQVAGVVRNSKYMDLRENDRPIAYLPSAQDESPDASTTFVLRIAGPAGDAVRAIKQAVAEVNPGIDLHTHILTAQLQESLLRDRLMATLAGAFGLLAGLLATLGLYGVIAYMVERRRSEIGLRMALGANRGSVVRLVLREAALLLAAGLASGTLLSLWAGEAASSLLFGIKPGDPAVLASAIVLLAGVALLASYGPAYRASRVEPMRALREE